MMTSPDRDGKIFVGKGASDAYLTLALANRHGLVTGATGTGKTVSLQVLAEGFSRAGVPVFAADIKGDLSGIAARGEAKPDFVKRANGLGFDYAPEEFPVVFWDLFAEQGHPIRATVFEMGPLLVSRMLELNDVEEGVINVAFRFADDDPELKVCDDVDGLVGLRDLRELLSYLSKNAKEVGARYGNVAVTAVGAVERQLLVLENQGGAKFFGEPALSVADLMRTDSKGRGVINVLAADKLIASPRLYATFLLWLISELFEKLPEVGDPPTPKLVFFFDEAHLLFNEAPKELLDKVEQVVRLIRSKGVGVYFVTQNPLDVPEKVLDQLGNRMQHALRAFTPHDQKAVKAAAETFRPNPKLDTVQVITQLGKGEALVSFLEGDGTPAMVDRIVVRPPSARIGPVTPDERKAVMAASPVKGKYDQAADPQSACGILQKRLAAGGALPPAGAAAAPATPGGPATSGQAPAPGGILHRVGEGFRNLFGIGRPRGATLTTSQQVARNVARAVATGVATTVAAELARSTGSKTAGTISKAVVRGALGGVLKR
ncbi:MAG: helicase HerA-like domain-containing protein [Xanthobacteraceae bacterium]